MAPSPRTILLAVALAALVGVVIARARRNLALHKPITASSTRYGRPESLVNGFVEWGHYGLHTKTDRPAWVMIDLQRTYRIGEVLIFGRNDSSIEPGTIGVLVQVSVDGGNFDAAGTCPMVLSQASPCRVRPGGVPARYIRLQHPYLVLSEIEVFEAR